MDSKTMQRHGPNCFNRDERRRASKLVKAAGLKPGSLIYTGTGKVNRIVRRIGNEVHIVTHANGPNIVFKMDSIISAAAYLLRVRLVERRELEQYHSFSSCLFGILMLVFKDKVKLFRQHRLLRLILKGLRFFLSGADKSLRDMKIAVQAGARFFLLSYYWLRNKKTGRWKQFLKKNGLRIVLDSGAFSVWMAKKNGKQVEDVNLDDYISFVTQHQDVIEAAIALDVVGDPVATKENLRIMEERSPVPPIPVFHLGSPIDELHQMVESGKYPVIALGGTVNRSKEERRKFLSTVYDAYPNFPFHGLGISDTELILSYPFFTCDSSVWLQGRRKNVKLTCNGQVKGLRDAPLGKRLKVLCDNVKFLLGLEASEFIDSLKQPGAEQLNLAF